MKGINHIYPGKSRLGRENSKKKDRSGEKEDQGGPGGRSNLRKTDYGGKSQLGKDRVKWVLLSHVGCDPNVGEAIGGLPITLYMNCLAQCLHIIACTQQELGCHSFME